MTRWTALLLAVLTTLSLAHGSVAASAPILPTTTADIREENTPAFSGPSASQHVDALSTGIGSRVAGSPAQAQTHQYLMARFQEMGYQVELQPFPITAYRDQGSTVALTSAPGQAFSPNTLQYSVGGAVEAPVVEAGLGKVDDFAVEDVRGRIALVTRGDTRFSDKVQAATD